MNTQKKKNKNRPNKPQNPLPPQNVESDTKDGEKLDTSASVVDKPELQVKAEERVPEILSEVVTVQAGDTKDGDDNDSPKKPKRNRGKKKKGDKDEPVDVSEEKIPTGELAGDAKVSGEEKDDKKSKKQQKANKSGEQNVPVAPTNRKKKGENKSHDNTDKILLESKNEPVSENSGIKEENPSVGEIQEPETKSTKKKNKKNKKNRNDSDKSEKAEDGDAYQKIIQDVTVPEDNKETIMKMEKPTDKSIDTHKKTDVVSPQDVDTPKTEGSKSKKKNKKDKKQPPKEEVSDGKLTPTQLFNISQDVKPMTFVEFPEEKEVIEIREEDLNIVIVTADVIDNVTIPITKELSPKPKAKIAKPVEKKGKDKKYDVAAKQENVELTEIFSKDKELEAKPDIIEEEDDDMIMCPITDDSPEDVFVEVTKKKDKGKSTKSMPIKEEFPNTAVAKEQEKIMENPTKETKTKDSEKAVEMPETVYESEKSYAKSTTDIEKPNQKKAKKGKQPLHEVVEQSTEDQKEKQIPSEISLALILEPPKIEASIKEKSMEKTVAEPSKESEIKQESVKKQHQQKGHKAIPMPDFATEALSPEITNTAKESEKIMPDVEEIKITAEIMSSTKPPPDNIPIPEQQTAGTRKKSPKPSKRCETDKNYDINVDLSKVTEEKTDLKFVESKPNVTKDENKLLHGGQLAEANISEGSVDTKTEECKSSSIKIDMTHKISQASAKTPTNITPDMIESPRSTSADIIDGNNNMMIREINTPATLTIPIVIPDTPLISSSGESQKEPHGIKITEIKDVGTSKDVKSKMIEVNQDMEDLRLSIEKSLAELTALEKKDEEFGIKQIESKLFDVGVKKDTPHLLTPIQETEVQLKLPTDFVREEKSAQDMSPKIEKPIDASVTKDSTGTLAENIPAVETSEPPVCPSRKDNKGKNKSKKKDNKQATDPPPASSESSSAPETVESTQGVQETKPEEKSGDSSQTQSQKEQGKQQTSSSEQERKNNEGTTAATDTEVLFDPIEHFEDAMTSSADDVNKSFEIIANEATSEIIVVEQKPNPEINITEPDDVDKDKDKKTDSKQDKINPIVSQPKNLLGHPVIPVRSNKIDYKKEKNKTPNLRQAKVKIKDSSEVEKTKKESKESQTENKPKFIKNKGFNESVTCVTSENDEYVYKYSFRKVFLSSNCHVCKKELKDNRVACEFCHLLFYCGKKHKDEDFSQHQAFCFAVSTICHLKGLKHIYAETQGVTGHDFRLLRMQLIVSCEQVLKRRLLPSEQEALLYPRVCADGACRQFKAGLLADCPGCGLISYCADNPEHLPKSHGRWCKSYCLYQKLVVHQLSQGRLEPRLPTKVLTGERICDNVNRLLADMYDERIDMTDIQYAALTQLATAPLTAAYSYQLYRDKMKTVLPNGANKSTTFTIHVVGAELQFEADSLNKWEVFFLHLKPDVQELKVVLVGPDLNPSNLPLDLLGNIKLCPTCRVDKRRVVFKFQDKVLYHQYRDSEDFVHPDIVCAFNPSIHRSARYNHSTWTPILNSIFRLKSPFCITAYSMNELQRDLATVKGNSQVDFNVVSEAKFNPFASVRPDRNFITDDEIPLLFKNYCYGVLIGAF